MNLNISFIARKLEQVFGETLVYNDFGDVKFDSVRLLVPDREVEPGVLYVCSDLSLGASIEADGAGLVMIGAEAPLVNLPCIWVRRDVDCYRVMEALLDIIEFYLHWGERVESMLLDHTATKYIVPLLTEVSKNPVVYLDGSLHMRYFSESDYLSKYSDKWNSLKTVGSFTPEILTALISSGELDRANSETGAWLFAHSSTFAIPLGLRTIVCDGVVYGYLATVGCVEDPALGDLDLLEYVGNLISQYVGHSRETISNSNRIVDKIIKDCLLSPAGSEADYESLASLMGWDSDDRYVVSLFFSPKGITQKTHVAMVEANLSGRAILLDSLVVHVRNASRGLNSKAFRARALSFCRSAKWQMAMGMECEGISGLGDSFQQAKIALREGQMQANRDGVLLYCYDDYRLIHICRELSRQIESPLLVSRDVFAIAKYDRENSSNLLLTLKVYLENERSVSRAASELFMHRNTIAYRIDKISELIRSDLDDADTRLAMLLSLRIWALNTNWTGE